jgi:Zinc knuckle
VVFIAEMENLRVKIGEAGKDFAINDIAFIIWILNSLPKPYTGLVQVIENLFNDTMSNADLNDICKKFVLHYQQLNGIASSSGDSNETSDKVLYGGGFKGKCNKCGKYGHKGSACRSIGNSNQGNSKNNKLQGANQSNQSHQLNQNLSNLQCHYCKETGHFKSDSPKLKNKKGGQNRGGAFEPFGNCVDR